MPTSKQEQARAEVTARRRLVNVALGQAQADLVFRGGRLVNVYTGEIEEGVEVAVAGERIALVGDASACIGPQTQVVGVAGAYLAPGFVDAHYHIESSRLTPWQHAQITLPRGITALVEDPHEACASGGLEAIRYMLESTEGLAQKVYVQVSSATPASNVETTGGYIGGAEAREALTWARVIGLGELMDPPRIFGGDPRIWDLIQVAIEIGQPIEGHSGFGGAKLAAYAAAGVHDTHSPRTPNWAIEMLRRGFEIQLKLEREMATVPCLLSSQVDWSRIGLAVDDRAVEKLLEIGGLDHEVRESIRLGIPVMTAYQMATVNNARHWRLERDHGGIAPGRMADILVISDLAAVKVDRVFAGGREVARDGRMLQTAAPAPATPAYALGTVRLARPVTAADFAVQAPAGRTEVQALVLPPFYWGRREKEAITQTLQVAGGQVLADPARGINKVAIVERHKGTGKIGLSFGSWGFARGAVAMSVLHDSHNISVVGASEADMAVAVNRLAELQGGIVVAEGGRVLAELALPVYGMMSDRDPHQVAAENLQVEQAAASLRAGNEHTVDARWMAPQYLNRINAQPLDVLTFAFLTCDPWHYVVTDQGMFDMSDESPLPLVW